MTTSAPIDPNSVKAPLWGTQASGDKGLASWDAGKKAFVWYELPNWAERMADGDPNKPKLGEPIHPEMDLIPANEAAQEAMFSDEDPEEEDPDDELDDDSIAEIRYGQRHEMY
ncbi:MAG TPA: hypothetical protein VFT87_00240 [Candidatus Saccharimonadales bacterium]|nr:hypothetical protein [Candidatus Saccharimonadales bacterium]